MRFVGIILSDIPPSKIFSNVAFSCSISSKLSDRFWPPCALMGEVQEVHIWGPFLPLYPRKHQNVPNNSSLESPVIFPFQRSWWSCHHAWYCVILDLPARHYLELLIQPSPTRPVWQLSIPAPNSHACHCGWFYRTWGMRASSIEYNTAVIW